MKNKQPNRNRTGITVLEVITAVLVAVIGVFGVVALIPFAVRQAENGLNQEDAINAARNLQGRFEVMGVNNPNRWFNGDPAVVAAANRPGFGINQTLASVYCIDPIGVSYSASQGDAYANYRAFPRIANLQMLAPQFPQQVYDFNPATGLVVGGSEAAGIPRINLLRSGNQPYSLARSRQTFGYSNDLIFENTQEKFDPPNQKYFRNAAGAPYKRQVDGNTTCMTFVVRRPGSSISEYTMYTVVFRKRIANSADRLFSVNNVAGLPNILFGGGDLQVTEQTTPGKDARRIGRNDWVMMLCAEPSSLTTVRDIQFYRVTESYETGVSGQTTFTLQGGDFDLSPDSGGNRPQPYIIYMPDVLAVYENSFRVEASSDWN